MSGKCSLKVLSDSGKMLYGSAAQEVYIKRQGGWDNYMEDLTADITVRVTEKVVSEVVSEIRREQSKQMFKVI